MSRAARLNMIDPKHPELPIVKQCVLLNVARSTVYYRPAPESAENLMIMRLIDEQYLRCLLYTSPSPRDGLLSRMPSSA